MQPQPVAPSYVDIQCFLDRIVAPMEAAVLYLPDLRGCCVRSMLSKVQRLAEIGRHSLPRGNDGVKCPQNVEPTQFTYILNTLGISFLQVALVFIEILEFLYCAPSFIPLDCSARNSRLVIRVEKKERFLMTVSWMYLYY